MEFDKRIDFLESMHNIMLHLNDEDAYMQWVELVPDEPDAEDFSFIASGDVEFEDAIQWYKTLTKEYMKYGIDIYSSGTLQQLKEKINLIKSIKTISDEYPKEAKEEFGFNLDAMTMHILVTEDKAFNEFIQSFEDVTKKYQGYLFEDLIHKLNQQIEIEQFEAPYEEERNEEYCD